MFVVLLPNVFHTNDVFALSEKSAEKNTKTGRLPIAHYKQKPAGSDLWPVNRCIPTREDERNLIWTTFPPRERKTEWWDLWEWGEKGIERGWEKRRDVAANESQWGSCGGITPTTISLSHPICLNQWVLLFQLCLLFHTTLKTDASCVQSFNPKWKTIHLLTLMLLFCMTDSFKETQN